MVRLGDIQEVFIKPWRIVGKLWIAFHTPNHRCFLSEIVRQTMNWSMHHNLASIRYNFHRCYSCLRERSWFMYTTPKTTRNHYTASILIYLQIELSTIFTGSTHKKKLKFQKTQKNTIFVRRFNFSHSIHDCIDVQWLFKLYNSNAPMSIVTRYSLFILCSL